MGEQVAPAAAEQSGGQRAPWSFINRLGSLPGVVTVLVAIMAAYMTLVAFGNITDFGTNQQFVQHVLKMDTTFNDPDVMWRSIDNSTLADIGYIFIIIWESLAAILLWIGAWLLFQKLRGKGDWSRARATAGIGLVMVLILFGFGFITVGGEWFSMWQSGTWNGLGSALRNFTMAAFTLVLLHLPAKEWAED